MTENNLSYQTNKNLHADSLPANQRIVVLGASAGGFEAFKTLIKELPPDFQPPIFIVWHMAPDVRGIVPQVLNKINTIYAAHAYDNEEIKPNRIYVAPPDYHLLIEDGHVRITHGPKENRFRPAIDPLFRSAAFAYGNRVVGIILSGALDDGTAGMWTIKKYGGTTIVQDPKDAEVRSMPENAIREVDIDYCVPVVKIPDLLDHLAKENVIQNLETMKDEQTKKEIEVAADGESLAKGLYSMGELTPFTCPECHGVLSKLRNGKISRFRCHTGHAYSVDALMTSISESIEDSLYSAIRGIDESIMLLNHLGDHYAEANLPKVAAEYFNKAKEAQRRSEQVRDAVLNSEHLNNDKIRNQGQLENEPENRTNLG